MSTPGSKFSLNRAQASVLILLAGWSTLKWYGARLNDGSDEPLGLLVLLAALWFAPRSGWGEPLPFRRIVLALGFLGLQAGGEVCGAPPLLRAALWMAAAAAVISPATCPLAWSALLTLSLPVIASLQFYLGYPVRVVVTWAASGLLRLVGYQVVSQATLLCWAGERVLIDAPCSGLQMAWTLSVLTLVIAVARSLDGSRTGKLLRFGAAMVWVANVLRAALIFLLQMRCHLSTPWIHDALGLALFALASGAVLWRGERLCRQRLISAGQSLPAAVA